MCNCNTSITEQLTERFKAAQPDASNHRITLEGYGFTITDGKMALRPYMPYKAAAEYPLKKGGTKWKSKTGTMVFKFCPFCGEDFDKTEQA